MTLCCHISIGSRCCCFSTRWDGCMDNLPLFSSRRPLYYWGCTLCWRSWSVQFTSFSVPHFVRRTHTQRVRDRICWSWHGLNDVACRLVPAGDTEFAKDASFGFKSSNLREVRIIIFSTWKAHHFKNSWSDLRFDYLFSIICIWIQWVEEKTSGRIPASSVASISIQLLRKGGPDAVCERLCSLQKVKGIYGCVLLYVDVLALNVDEN